MFSDLTRIELKITEFSGEVSQPIDTGDSFAVSLLIAALFVVEALWRRCVTRTTTVGHPRVLE